MYIEVFNPKEDKAAGSDTERAAGYMEDLILPRISMKQDMAAVELKIDGTSMN